MNNIKVALQHTRKFNQGTAAPLPEGYEYDMAADKLLLVGCEGIKVLSYNLEDILVLKDGIIKPLLDMALELGVGCGLENSNYELACNFTGGYLARYGLPKFKPGTNFIYSKAAAFNADRFENANSFICLNKQILKLTKDAPFKTKDYVKYLVVGFDKDDFLDRVNNIQLQNKSELADELLNASNIVYVKGKLNSSKIEFNAEDGLTVIVKNDIRVYNEVLNSLEFVSPLTVYAVDDQEFINI